MITFTTPVVLNSLIPIFTSCVAFGGVYQIALTSSGLTDWPSECRPSTSNLSRFARLALAGSIAALTKMGISGVLTGQQASIQEFTWTIELYLMLCVVVMVLQQVTKVVRDMPVVVALESSGAARARLRNMSNKMSNEEIYLTTQTLKQRLSHLVHGKKQIPAVCGSLFDYFMIKVSKGRYAAKRDTNVPVFTPEINVDLIHSVMFDPAFGLYATAAV